MTQKVGDIVNIGSEFNARLHGNSERTADGKIRTPTIGHKGQEGSDPNFPDNRDHIITTTAVNENAERIKLTHTCTCGLEWTHKERTENVERRNIFDKET